MAYFGKFEILAQCAKTGDSRVLAEYQDNLILNNFFNSEKAAKDLNSLYCFFGTGSAPVTVNDTSLSSPIAESIMSPSYFNGSYTLREMVGGELTHQVTIPFKASQGQIRGNITEIGLSLTSDQSGLMTRALTKDSDGSPAAISVGEFDIVTVNYTIGMTIDSNETLVDTQLLTIGGEQITAELHWCDFNNNDKYPSLWITGNSVDDGNAINNLRTKALHPAAYISSAFPFTGDITDYGNVYGKITPMDSMPSSRVYKSIGGELVTEMTLTSGKGSHLGVWNGIIFSNQTSYTPGSSSSGSATCLIKFTPPINKGANDIIKLTPLKFKTKRAAP